MPRMVFGAALLVLAATARAQHAPARDLLNFPLGLTGEPAALGGGAASGLWNPATALLAPGERARVAAAALSAPVDVALSGQVLHAAYAAGRIGTISLGVARAAIQDLVHTETDPQSIGNDVPYSTWVISGGLARRFYSHLSAGAAIRWRRGHVYQSRSSVLVSDFGVVADGLTRWDVRVAAATYLLTVGSDDSPTLSVAADARVAGADTSHYVRGGLSVVDTHDGPRETYPFLEGRFDKFVLRGGPLHIRAYGNSTWRLRMAFLLRHGGYTLSIGREENSNGLPATYQLGVSSIFK